MFTSARLREKPGELMTLLRYVFPFDKRYNFLLWAGIFRHEILVKIRYPFVKYARIYTRLCGINYYAKRHRASLFTDYFFIICQYYISPLDKLNTIHKTIILFIRCRLNYSLLYIFTTKISTRTCRARTNVNGRAAAVQSVRARTDVSDIRSTNVYRRASI